MRRTEGVLASDVVPVRSDSSCERALKVMMSRLLSEPPLVKRDGGADEVVLGESLTTACRRHRR